MATAAQVAEFRAANQALVTLAQRELREFWEALNLSGDPVLVRDALLAFLPDLITAYGDTAAVLGADWYDLLRDVPASAASFNAVMASAPNVSQVEGSVRWGVGPLFQEAPDSALERLMGSTQRLVLQAGRDSIFDSARRDPVRTAVARVPSGAETCRFCVMLASRGAVYANVRTAGGDGNSYHDNCDCVPTIIRSESDWPEGHDLQRFRDLYAKGSGIGREVEPDALHLQ